MGGFDLDAARGGRRRRRGGALPGSRPAHAAGRQVAGRGRKRKWPQRVTGCWRRCASTRWKSSASPARPTPCAPVTVTTTRPWPPCSTPPQPPATSSARAGRNRDRQPARRIRVEPGKLRYRDCVAARVVAAAAVAHTGPHPGRAGLVRRRPHRPRCTAQRCGARGARAALADKAVLARVHGCHRLLGAGPRRPWRSRAKSMTAPCCSGR